MFRTQASLHSFSSGTGTPYCLPSMPIAQIARYWWAAQQWRINYSYTDGVSTFSNDSGWEPYGYYVADNYRYFCSLSGDTTKGATLSDRYLENTYENPEEYNGLFPYDPTSYDGLLYADFGVSVAFLCRSKSTPLGTKPLGCVWDDSISGNAFMPVRILSTTGFPFQYSIATDVDDLGGTSASAKSSIIGSFDGAAFDIYQASETPILSGTFSVLTKDTTS